MPINVVCPGCKKRFQVNEKFAGKQGPCPACKVVITIPKADEQVVIHAPEEFGPKGTTGRAVLKPIFRTESKWNPVVAATIGGAVLVVLIVALLLGSSYKQNPHELPTVILALGAILLAPPLALGGYTFLRDSELEAFTGTALWLRIGICAAGFAFTWGLLAITAGLVQRDAPLDFMGYVFFVAPMVLLGALASFAALDLEFTMGAMHYCMYLGATVLLRLLMGLLPFWGPWNPAS